MNVPEFALVEKTRKNSDSESLRYVPVNITTEGNVMEKRKWGS
jgi:hypothetical protein